MSSSSDDRGGRRPPPAPTQRTPGGYPTPRQDVAPPPPRSSRDLYPDDEPRGSTPFHQGFELEPTPLRGQGRARGRDIEPPVDGIGDVYREFMTQPPPKPAQQQANAQVAAQVAAQNAARAAATQAAPTLSAASNSDQDLYAETRTGRAGKERGVAPIVPAGSVTGKSLTLVIGIMCFLACLTAGAVYLMNQSASAWLRDIAAEVTVQVEARDKIDVDKLVAAVAVFLEKQPGIKAVKPLSGAENAALLEPWLVQGDVGKAAPFQLPVPRLIALEIDRNQPPNFEALRAAMAAQFKAGGVTLDDHRHWQQQIRTVTRSFALGGLAILMLVGAATTAIIVSATRSALSANKEIVEVLHFVGATDRFIAREFAGHFLWLGIKAGVVGAGAAMLAFFSLPFMMELIGGGSVTMAEIRRLVGAGSLDMPGYALLGVVVIVVAALCMLTSRIGVYRILNQGPEGGAPVGGRRF
jgi:cell division transport system permease protein